MEKQLIINIPNGYEIDKEKSTFECIIFKELSKEDKQKQMSNFLFETLNGMSLKLTNENEITYYNSKNEWLIQQDYKNGKLYISYIRIWSVFESKFKLNHQEIRKFISAWVETNLNWKGLTPNLMGLKKYCRVETNLNWKGLTPCNQGVYQYSRVETNLNWKGLTPNE